MQRRGFDWEPDHEAVKAAMGIENADTADKDKPGLSKLAVLEPPSK